MSRLSPLLLAALVTACGGATCPEPATTTPGARDRAGDDSARQPVARAAEVRDLEDAPERAAPPGTATVRLLAEGQNAFLGRLVMEPNAAVPEHADSDEEYIHVLEGHGTIWIDGVASEVRPGATIFMPAGARVRFQNGDARMVAIQVFAGPGSAAKYDRWTPTEARSADVE